MFPPTFEISPEDSRVMDDFINGKDTINATCSLQHAEIETEDFILDHANPETLARYTTTVDTEHNVQMGEGQYYRNVADTATTRPELVTSTTSDTDILLSHKFSGDFEHQGDPSYGHQQETTYHFTGSSLTEPRNSLATPSIVCARFDQNTEYRDYMQQYVENAHPAGNISQSFDDMDTQFDPADNRTQ